MNAFQTTTNSFSILPRKITSNTFNMIIFKKKKPLFIFLYLFIIYVLISEYADVISSIKIAFEGLLIFWVRVCQYRGWIISHLNKKTSLFFFKPMKITIILFSYFSYQDDLFVVLTV